MILAWGRERKGMEGDIPGCKAHHPKGHTPIMNSENIIKRITLTHTCTHGDSTWRHTVLVCEVCTPKGHENVTHPWILSTWGSNYPIVTRSHGNGNRWLWVGRPKTLSASTPINSLFEVITLVMLEKSQHSTGCASSEVSYHVTVSVHAYKIWKWHPKWSHSSWGSGYKHVGLLKLWKSGVVMHCSV